MGREFEYDEEGDSSSFFLLAALSIEEDAEDPKPSLVDDEGEDLSPEAAQAALTAHAAAQAAKAQKAKLSQANPPSLFSRSNIFYFLCILLFAYLCFNVSQMEQEDLYDPFVILGLDYSATNKEIKKRYRELSLKFHPDRNPDNPDAQDQFVRISKAYKALTDAETRLNWEQYGNPDGPQEKTYGIALPAWLVSKENKYAVLYVYAILLLFVVPIAVYIWARRNKQYVKGVVLKRTIQLFAWFVSSQILPIETVFKVMTLADEFQRRKLGFSAEEEDEINRLCQRCGILPPWEEKPDKQLNPLYAQKARILLLSHMNKVPINNENMNEELAFCLEQVPVLIMTMVEACCSRRRLRNAIKCMQLSQAVVQGCPFSIFEEPLFQVPNMTDEIVKSLSLRKKIKSLRSLYSQSPERIEKMIGKKLSKEKIDEVIEYGRHLPFIVVDVTLWCSNPKINDFEQVEAADGVVYERSNLRLDFKIRRLNCEELAQSREEGKQAKPEAVASSKKVEEPEAEADKEEDAQDGEGDESGDEEQDYDDDMYDDVGDKPVKKDKIEAHPAHCLRYPFPKAEEWWAFVGFPEVEAPVKGDKAKVDLVDLLNPYEPPKKIIDLMTECEGSVYFPVPLPAGKVFKPRFYVLSDSYVGLDVAVLMTLKVEPAPTFTLEELEKKVQEEEEAVETEQSGDEEEDEFDEDY